MTAAAAGRQLPLPLQAPDQLWKVQPAAACADRLTTVPNGKHWPLPDAQVSAVWLLDVTVMLPWPAGGQRGGPRALQVSHS